MHEVPVERSGTYYLITLKCNNKKYTSMDEVKTVYTRLLRRLGHYDLSDHRAWELDGDKRWHYHFICALSRTPYYTRCQVPNWTVHFQQFPEEDYFDVVNYLQKVDQRSANLENLDFESSLYYNPNPFVDD